MSERRSAVKRPLMVWRVLGALLLLAMGEIHFFLVLSGTGGLLGALFVVNAVASLVLAIALVIVRQRLMLVSSLSLLLVLGTLLALLIALSPVSLFGMRSSLDYPLAPTSLGVESVGLVVLVVTTALAFSRRS
ncbi:hypothetical protein [Saccharopolyspora mangrovi]|uniref:Uncharacterized protein n=1 Tax=Saccharopolyspora mangrovi TaxID=3082379 RepID=A0ABU6AJ55_9PSEU|nr:hypothetical protein [Saccharopolyspora sp. S2-29]MEB3371599.1 hypothetical protein [Saccharopolyspora sp. S2-29]